LPGRGKVLVRRKYLIVGGAGEAGQSAIEYLKSSEKDCHIIATTSNQSIIPGADTVLENIKADPQMSQRIQEELEREQIEPNFEAMIYTPALGEVGYPVIESKSEAIEAALEISYYPMLKLEKKFSPKISIGYSAFYWLPHTLAFYGTMGHVKKKMDEWAIENPNKRRIIRAGTFYSKSVRGISLVLQRTMKLTRNPDLLKLKEKYTNSNQKFQDFFLDYAWKHERDFFSSPEFKLPYRATTRSDLSRGLKNALTSDKPIATVLGDWDWYENALPQLPNWF